MNGGTRHVLALAGGGAGGGWQPGGASLSGSSGGGGSSHPIADTAAGVRAGDGLLRISGEAVPETPDPQADGDVDAGAVEAPRPQSPTAAPTVETPSFTG